MKYKYFLSEYKTEKDIYRSPANGNSFIDNLTLVEYFDSKNNKWTKDEKKIMKVRNEIFSGWFSEKNDEISEAMALKKIEETIDEKK